MAGNSLDVDGRSTRKNSPTSLVGLLEFFELQNLLTALAPVIDDTYQANGSENHGGWFGNRCDLNLVQHKEFA